MRCLHPVVVEIPDESRLTGKKRIFAPCGKCEACYSNLRAEWQLRLETEFKHSVNSYFITLTYDDDHLPLDVVRHYTSDLDIVEDIIPVFSKKDISSMMKRFRKRLGTSGIRFFIAGEYGPQTFRPHYHGLLFNLPNVSIKYVQKILEECWRNGFVSVSRVTPARVGYVAKYINTFTLVPEYYPRPPICASRNPAIGNQIVSNTDIADYCRKTQSFSFKRNVTSYGKNVVVSSQIPRLFRERMFSYDELKSIKDKSLKDQFQNNDSYFEYKRLYKDFEDGLLDDKGIYRLTTLIKSTSEKRRREITQKDNFLRMFYKRTKNSHKQNK